MMPGESENVPALTRRGAIERLLLEGWQTLEALARALGARIREIEDDLEHVSRSRKRLSVRPAECEDCGFVFRKRDRLTTPSRCPNCRSERVDPPRFRLD